MARASLKITKTRTSYKFRTKVPKSSSSKSSGKKKGNPRHCPVCGKFI